MIRHLRITVLVRLVTPTLCWLLTGFQWFCTNSYGESVLGLNLRKIMSPSPEPLSPSSKTWVPGSPCNHTVDLKRDSKTLNYSYWNKNILQRPQEQPATEITWTGYSTKTSSDRSIDPCVLPQIIFVVEYFYSSGIQDAEVTKSLGFVYCIILLQLCSPLQVGVEWGSFWLLMEWTQSRF